MKSVEELITEHCWEEGTAIAHVKSSGTCEYCGEDLLQSWKTYAAMQIDHLLPKSVYDGHRFDFDNYVTSCSTCNHLKRNFDPLREGENPTVMLKEGRNALIERVVDHLRVKSEHRDQEFRTIKPLIRPEE